MIVLRVVMVTKILVGVRVMMRFSEMIGLMVVVCKRITVIRLILGLLMGTLVYRRYLGLLKMELLF